MIRKELSIFLIVGGMTVLVDYMTYRGILQAGLLETDLAKGGGFLAGTIFAYFANRAWTFGVRANRAGSAWRFAALYTLTLIVNTYANSLMLSVLFGRPYPVQLAFTIATGLSATINFLGMKYLVFVNTRRGGVT